MACMLAVTIAKGKVSGEQLIKILTNELVSGLLTAYGKQQAYNNVRVFATSQNDVIAEWSGVRVTVNRVRHVQVESYSRSTADRVRAEVEQVLSLGAQQAIATLIQQAVVSLGTVERRDQEVEENGVVKLATQLRIAF